MIPNLKIVILILFDPTADASLSMKAPKLSAIQSSLLL